MTEQFKKGDRVRVTDVLEAEVTGVTDRGLPYLKGYGVLDPSSGYGDWKRTVEKVAPPEPTWVSGDVVLLDGREKVYYLGGQWHWDSGAPMILQSCVSEMWAEGKAEVLLKADQQGVQAA